MDEAHGVAILGCMIGLAFFFGGAFMEVVEEVIPYRWQGIATIVGLIACYLVSTYIVLVLGNY